MQAMTDTPRGETTDELRASRDYWKTRAGELWKHRDAAMQIIRDFDESWKKVVDALDATEIDLEEIRASLEEQSTPPAPFVHRPECTLMPCVCFAGLI